MRLPASIRFLAYITGISLFVLLLYKASSIKIPPVDQQILGHFLEWFGVLYSVLFGLIIVHVWTKFNTVESLIDKEADAFVSLLRFAKMMLPPKTFQRLATVIDDYCRLYLQTPNKIDKNAVRAKMDIIFSELLRIAKRTKLRLLAREIMRLFDEACDIRGDREALCHQRTHGPLWFMMIYTSMIWLLGFFWLGSQNMSWKVGAFMLLVTSFSMLGLLFIAKDIDNPTSGFWRIQFHSFQEACDEIERLLVANGKKARAST